MFETILPLISCLCVTNKRSHLLRRAINCFLGQSYPNKEMVLVCNEKDTETIDVINSLKNERLIAIKISGHEKLTLGELRNISIEKSNGEYFCQWDDDDWSHRDRLRIQYESAVHNHHPASMLTNMLMFDKANNQAYFSYHRLWEPTILAKRTMFDKIKYKPLRKAEDTEFMNAILIGSRIYPVIAHNLYIYLYHGNNTCDHDHTHMLFGIAQKLSSGISTIIGNIFNDKYSYDKACDLLSSDLFLDEINYFSYKRNVLRKEQEGSAMAGGIIDLG